MPAACTARHRRDRREAQARSVFDRHSGGRAPRPDPSGREARRSRIIPCCRRPRCQALPCARPAAPGPMRILAHVPDPPARYASLRTCRPSRFPARPCAIGPSLAAKPEQTPRTGDGRRNLGTAHRPQPHRNSPQRRCRQPKRQGLPWRCIARPMRVSTKTMLRRRNGGDKRCGTKRTAATTNCTWTLLPRCVRADALRFRSIRRPSMAVARWPRTAQRGCSSVRTASR